MPHSDNYASFRQRILILIIQASLLTLPNFDDPDTVLPYSLFFDDPA